MPAESPRRANHIHQPRLVKASVAQIPPVRSAPLPGGNLGRITAAGEHLERISCINQHGRDIARRDDPPQHFPRLHEAFSSVLTVNPKVVYISRPPVLSPGENLGSFEVSTGACPSRSPPNSPSCGLCPQKPCADDLVWRLSTAVAAGTFVTLSVGCVVFRSIVRGGDHTLVGDSTAAPITVVRGAGRRLTRVGPAAASRSREISSCCAASRARAWGRKSVSSSIVCSELTSRSLSFALAALRRTI